MATHSILKDEIVVTSEFSTTIEGCFLYLQGLFKPCGSSRGELGETVGGMTLLVTFNHRARFIHPFIKQLLSSYYVCGIDPTLWAHG